MSQIEFPFSQSNRSQDFPIFLTTMRGKPFTYLDSGATSLTPKQVVDAMSNYYLNYGVNVHRGVYEFSERATREYEEVRVKVAAFLGISKSNPKGQVIFTKSTTEASNLLAYSYGRKMLQPGDEILTTGLEHHSTLVPWQPVVQKNQLTMKFVPLTPQGTYDLQDVIATISDKTKLAVFSAMSNVTGFIPPLKEMIQFCKSKGIITMVDGAQYVSHHPINLDELDCDFLYFSAHKMLGPTGLGVLYGKTQLLDAMDPFLYGGNMILRVTKEYSTYHPLPEKFEAGTPPIAEVIGFGHAIDYLNTIGMEAIRTHEQDLLTYGLKKAQEWGYMELYGPSNPKIQGAIMSFNIPGVHSHDIGTLLDSQGVAVRTGVHCAQPFMETLGTSGTIRASMYLYNTKEDIDILFDALEKARNIFI